jgi:hypothetical protein
LRALNTDESARKRDLLRERLVNPVGQGNEIRVEGADNHALVFASLFVQANEMLAVQGEQNAPFAGGKRQDLVVRHRPVASADLLDGEYIVAEASEFLHSRQGKILVGVAASHG